MKRSTYTSTTLGMAAMLALLALSGCHSSRNTSAAQNPQQLNSPTVGQHEASSIDSNPNLTPAQKAAAKASLQQEYGGGAAR